MGTVGDAYDNAVAEGFFGTLQLELLDSHRWTSRDELAAAMFEWIECFYNPTRRHSHCGMLSPVDDETNTAASSTEPTCPEQRGNLSRASKRRSVGLRSID
jgi:putative transposase